MPYRVTGVGMLEFLVALLIFSTGMLGLLSVQLAAKKVNYEAGQRSVATILARDVLERMRANPRSLAAYRITNAGDAGNRIPAPPGDCNKSACSAAQLAAFDLWQWESLLMGESETYSGGTAAGGLILPRACITTEGAEVAVTISWLGVTTARQPAALTCGSDDTGSDGVPAGNDGNTLRRHQLMISTSIVGRR